MRDDAAGIVAGLSGFTWGGCCRVNYLWVAEPNRRGGLGRALLAAAETEALRRGCILIQLDTHDFQAPRFYEQLGYDEQSVMTLGERLIEDTSDRRDVASPLCG